MNTCTFIFTFALALFAFSPAGAQESADTAASELKALVAQTNAKIKSGQKSATDLAPDLAAFDALLAKYKDQKTEEVAQIPFMKAMLYLQVLKDTEKGNALIARIKTDFPGTKAAAFGKQGSGSGGGGAVSADKAALVGKPAPELHFQWASRKDMKSLSGLKGKVVVLDFWATWCGPCIGSFPKVRDLVEHYKNSDVFVVGVTSIQGKVSNLEPRPIDTSGDPDRETALMNDFIKAKDITWDIAFSEEKVFNPDFAVTGIPHLTIIAPDGTIRHNGLHPGMPLEEKTEKIDAILKEFRLAVPVAKKA